MKFRSTAILAVVLAILCAGYWGLKTYRAHTQRQALEAKRLLAFDGAAVRSLEIHRLNESPTAGERGEGGKWAITKPSSKIVALQFLWDRVAEQLARLTDERTIAPSGENAGQYGLDDPALTVTAKTSADEPIKLIFGDLDPTQKYRYAQLNGGAIFLVTKEVFFELDRSLKDLRHRFLVNDREAALVRITFARIWTGRSATKMENPPPMGTESVAVMVERASKDAPWRLQSPLEALADQDAVNALAKELQFAVGDEFVDTPEKLSDYGLDPPSCRITVCDEKDGNPQTILIGEIEKEKNVTVYAKRTEWDAVCAIDGNVLTLLPNTPDAFRERHVLTRPASDIRSVEYRSRTGDFTLEKHPEGGWKLVRPEEPDADQQAISDYISRLKSTVGNSFPGGTPESYGLNEPETTIQLLFAGDTAPASIRVKPASEQAESCYITQDTGAVMLAPKAQVEGLLANASMFHSRCLFRFEKKDAVKIEFQLEGQGYLLEKAHDQWIVKAPDNKILASQSDVSALLDALTPVYAVSQESSAKEKSAYGLDQPTFTAYVTTRKPDAPQGGERRVGPLAVGNVAPDTSQQRFASSADRAGIYRVKQDLIEAVREMLKGIRDQ